MLHVEQVSACSVAWSHRVGISASGEVLPADLAHKRGLLKAFLKVATIKKTPVLKREELYQGLIEPGWGAGL
jgi:hypothetical protein